MAADRGRATSSGTFVGPPQGRPARARTTDEVRAVRDLTFARRGRRDGRLHRPERRRQVDHDQDAHRHPGARPAGRLRVAGLDPSRQRTELARRIGVVFGQRTTLWWDLPLRDSFDLLQKIYRDRPRRGTARNLGGVRRAARPRRPARHPGPPAQPRPADARRHRRGAAARPRDPLPRRADHRPRRGQQGPAARVPAHPQRRARHHPAAHHPRPAGHRGALPPGDRDRPRHGWSSTARSPACTGRAARPARWSSTWSTRRRRSRCPGAGHARVEGPRQWLSFPADASAAPIVAAVAAAYDVADLSIQEPDIEDVIRELYSR